MSKDEKAEFDGCTILAETSKAVLVAIEDAEHWVPKSAIDDDSEVFDLKNKSGKLVVAQWWAEKAGLV